MKVNTKAYRMGFQVGLGLLERNRAVLELDYQREKDEFIKGIAAGEVYGAEQLKKFKEVKSKK